MPFWLYALLVGSCVGVVGTALGGAIGFAFKRFTARRIGACLGFSAGIMLAVVLVELLPYAFSQGNPVASAAALAAGILFVALFYRARGGLERGDSTMLSMGVMISVAIAMHNFPEGMAIGAGLRAGDSYTLLLIVALWLHDVPEGMSVAVPLRAGGLSAGGAFFYSALAGVPTGLGALFGAYISSTPALIAACMAFAGGTMLAITIREMLPQAKEMEPSPYATIVGVVVGAALSIFL